MLKTLNPLGNEADNVTQSDTPGVRLGPPLFIIGAPRSGTTYINTVVNRHPKVFVTNELRFMLFYHEAVFKAAKKLANAKALDDFVDHFKGDIRRQVESFFITKVNKLSLKTKQKNRVALNPPGVSDGCLWGDKNPFVGRAEFEGLTELMHEVFPDALYLHIYRDPRNSISSRMQRGKDSVESAVSDWRHIFQSCREIGERVGPERYLEVRYEALCSDKAEEIAGEIFKFLGLDLDTGVVDFLHQQEKERTPAGTPATGNDDIGNADVFKKRLTPEQIEEIDRGLGDIIRQLGYA